MEGGGEVCVCVCVCVCVVVLLDSAKLVSQSRLGLSALSRSPPTFTGRFISASHS